MMDSKKLVNYDFVQRTDFDRKLLAELRSQTKLTYAVNSMLSYLPIPISNDILGFGKWIKRKIIAT